MTIFNSHLRTTAPTKSQEGQALGRNKTYFGVYLGLVKDTQDVQKNGRIRVWIPELGSDPDNSDSWITASYCSPFSGATNYLASGKDNYAQFEKTQSSYGFWMVPPDINNEVLIMFINGRQDRPIWIGCLYQEYMNTSVPAIASNTNNYQYRGKTVPVTEYNKWNNKVTDVAAAQNQITRPYHKTKFNGISNQGLINDAIRGTTTSSARREAPSSVFGFITPGPAIDETAKPEEIVRKGGSSFVMDDKTGSEYIGLTTKSGAQVRIDETNGLIYVINRDGTAWVQMDKEGNIDIFGAKNISMRAQRDINLRADRNVNIEAGQNIFMKAAMDTEESTTEFTYDINNIPQPSTIPCWKYVGEGKGQGGNIVMQSLNNWHSTAKSSAFLTVNQDNFNIAVGNSFSLTTDQGGQNFSSKLGIKLTTDASLDLSATADIRVGTNGQLSAVASGNIAVCSDGSISLNSSADTIITSVDKISVDASSVEVGTAVYAESLEAQSIKAVSTETNSIRSDTIARRDEPIGGGYSGGAVAPVTENPIETAPVQSASSARSAEVKAMVEKINILATWKDPMQYQDWMPNRPYNTGAKVKNNQKFYIAVRPVPPEPFFDEQDWKRFEPDDKFKRKSESVETTVTRLPTYEPCPEHENFGFSSITGYTPKSTEQDSTYRGSGGAGNNASTSPPSSTTPGANNSSIPPESPVDSAVTKELNLAALKCQLITHEGYKNASYLDSEGLLTGGIGHLLRVPTETAQYPLGSPISESQIDQWYQQDVVSSIKGSQQLVGIEVWGDLSDIRKRALTDLCYNLGKSGLSKFSKFLSAMKAGDYSLAGRELQDSKWFTQVGRRGPAVVTMISQNVDPNKCDKKFPST